MIETTLLDERAVSEIEAQLNSGSLLLPLRVDHWHMSLSSGGGWYIKNASDRIVMTVAFVPVEIETGKPAIDGNAPARHTAALLNSIPALCATVKHLRAAAEVALTALESERVRLCGYCKQGHAFDVKQNAHVWRKLGDKFDGATLGCAASHLHGTIATLRHALGPELEKL